VERVEKEEEDDEEEKMEEGDQEFNLQ